MADTAGVRQQGQGESTDTSNQATDREGETSDALDVRIGHQWAVEPDVVRVAHGVPKRVDRLRGLGNAVVPQVVEWIGHRIMEVEAYEPV